MLFEEEQLLFPIAVPLPADSMGDLALKPIGVVLLSISCERELLDDTAELFAIVESVVVDLLNLEKRPPPLLVLLLMLAMVLDFDVVVLRLYSYIMVGMRVRSEVANINYKTKCGECQRHISSI